MQITGTAEMHYVYFGLCHFQSGPWTLRRQFNMGRHLDCDGLTTFIDPVQNRLSQIETDYQQKIQDLTQQLCMAKAIIYQYSAGMNGTGKHLENSDDIVSYY